MMRATCRKGAGPAVNMKNNSHNEITARDIISFDALYKSLGKCRKGVMWKASVASFSLNGIERVLKLAADLQRGTYRAMPPTRFRITSPKPREISSVAFRDRVYQRSLNDVAIYPIMTRSFIFDNWACQTGKGTDGARERVKEFLRRYYRRHGSGGWVAQFDISGYYPNMSHERTEALFRSKLPPDVYAMAERILREQYGGDRGYNPGSQLIQIAGISMLDSFDHFAKEVLRVRYYIRYMDDFLMIGADRAELAGWMDRACDFLTAADFRINEKKTRIFPLSDGIEFLGFHFRLTGTGRVLQLIRSDNVRRERRKLRRLVRRSLNGMIPREKVDESFKAWKNHAAKGNSFRLVRRMEHYYKSLWEGL